VTDGCDGEFGQLLCAMLREIHFVGKAFQGRSSPGH
jgi:hypothetical protein